MLGSGRWNHRDWPCPSPDHQSRPALLFDTTDLLLSFVASPERSHLKSLLQGELGLKYMPALRIVEMPVGISRLKEGEVSL